MIHRYNFWKSAMNQNYAASASELDRAHMLSHPMPHTPMPAAQDGLGSSSQASAVSWGAILAGAAGAAALSLILLMLGVGLGMSAVSPWAQSGASAKAFGVSTILWFTFTQLVASAMGGYLAGRLRTKWASAPSDEIYFRDTAHGFLAWAIASLATAAMLTSAIASIVGGGVQAVGAVAGTAATTAIATTGAVTAGASGDSKSDSASGPMAYFVDSLFRKDTATSAALPPDASGPAPSSTEVTRILMNTIRAGTLPAADARYVGQLVAQRTGLSQADAEKRVTDTYARMQASLNEAQASAKDAADTARKASAYGALWLFISLLAGAFVASLSATWGGRMRDT